LPDGVGVRRWSMEEEVRRDDWFAVGLFCRDDFVWGGLPWFWLAVRNDFGVRMGLKVRVRVCFFCLIAVGWMLKWGCGLCFYKGKRGCLLGLAKWLHASWSLASLVFFFLKTSNLVPILETLAQLNNYGNNIFHKLFICPTFRQFM